MNNAEWKQAEEMVYNWKIVELLIDDYKIQLQLQRIISYSPYFKSFRTLKSQYSKRHNNIEFLGEYGV